MKRIVFIYGLLCGAVLAVMMFATVPFIDRIGFDNAEVIGYTTLGVSFILFVFFGIRSYRESVQGGTITFARALKVGVLITLIASACYVIAWEIIYFNLLPGFADKYAAYWIEQLRASGASAEEINKGVEQMKTAKTLLDNPLTNAAVTLLEPFPIGFAISLLSSVILRKKKSLAD